MSYVDALDILTRELGAQLVVPSVDFARGRQHELERLVLNTRTDA